MKIHLIFLALFLLIPLNRGDSFSREPFPKEYGERVRAYLDRHSDGSGGLFGDLARLALGIKPDETVIKRRVSERIIAREDCADFHVHALIRLLYQFGGSNLISDDLRNFVRESLLSFKYWPDEPGIDDMCSWSENHHILFASAGYLVGQMFPDEIFTNSGLTGRQQVERHRPRILRWLDLRYKTGFSEWLSNVYYDQDATALLNLIDFCQDEEIVRKAMMVLDLLFLDMALNQFRGAFGSTHGRSYERSKTNANNEGTGTLFKLAFGLNDFDSGNMGGTCLALSRRYRVPRVISEIATDFHRQEMINKQRMGIRIEDARRWGLDTDRLEDGMTFLSLEAYAHPQTINLMYRMLNQYNWWENQFFKPFAGFKNVLSVCYRLRILPLLARLYEWDLTRNMRTEVNIYTYRTPDYMLSSAQDYRRGNGGDQQHIWSATLGEKAICFTTHPARIHKESPNYWTGSGNLPRVAQIRNVALIIYKLSTRKGLYITHKFDYTHAWLPKKEFDEVIERDHWVFARKGNGYLALWSRNPHYWQSEGNYRDIELISPGKENIWICEMGRKTTDGEFADFVRRRADARVETNGLNIVYESPSQGTLEFGWNGAPIQNGLPVRISHYPRYDNPYTTAPFPGNRIEVKCNGEWLKLDYDSLERDASGFLGLPESK